MNCLILFFNWLEENRKYAKILCFDNIMMQGCYFFHLILCDLYVSPPHFALHVYHHAAVLFMAWAWCEYRQSLQFIGLAWNTAVHVVMYTYFLQRTISKKVPKWKSFVTLFQIIQFAFSIVATAVTLHMVYIQNYECSGMGALFGNIIFNITLLHSFIGVLRQGKKRTANSNKHK